MGHLGTFGLAGIFAASLATSAIAGDGLKLEIGYMPILPDAQLFVTLEEGWMEQAGIDADLVQFQNGPAMVQALLAGQLDVAYFGIGPAMVARAKGADIKVVASNVVEQISVIALPGLAKYFDGDPATAFARFTAAEGRKPVISTFPAGSVPNTVLHYWLANGLKINADSIDIVQQGEAQVQQSLLTGAVDGAAILEPAVSTVLARDPDAKVVASGSALFPHQPGAVLAVREKTITDHRDAVEALVAAHVKATDLLRDHPDEAAPMVAKYVGGGRLPKDIVEAAIRRTGNGFVADPHAITEGTQAMQDFQITEGTLAQPVDLLTLFDLSVYDAAEGK